MNATVAITVPVPELHALGTVQQLADDFAGHAKAPRTVRAYATDWRDFVAWTCAHDRQALPAEPDTVAMYVADLAARGVRPSTLARRLVAISQAHKTMDLPSPTSSSAVRRTFAGIRRSVGTAQTTKAPVVLDQMVAMLEKTSPSSLRGLRDRALLLLGFAGAFRRFSTLDQHALRLRKLFWTQLRQPSGSSSAAQSVPAGPPPRIAPIRDDLMAHTELARDLGWADTSLEQVRRSPRSRVAAELGARAPSSSSASPEWFS